MSDSVSPPQALSPLVVRLTSIPLIVWAIGSVLSEGIAQAGLYLSMLVALIFYKRISVSPDVKRYAISAAVFAGWQAFSPVISLLNGTTQRWPRGLRYSQFLDTLAPTAGFLAAQVTLPLTAIALTLGTGWVLSIWLGTFQHFVEWPFGQPFWSKTPIARLHENFAPEGAPPRFGAGGFLIHRLRFAHGSVALLGPALALLRSSLRIRVVAALVTLHVIAAPSLAFTRAALGVDLLVLLVFAVSQLKGRVRLGFIVAALVVTSLSFLSDSWRQRVVSGIENLNGGERSIAMSAGLELIKAHPIVGVGFGNHQPLAFATHETTQVTEYLATDSHNLLLTTWAETGLIGVLLMLVMHVLLGSALFTRARAGNLFSLGALLSWLGFHVLCLVHYLPYHSGVHLSFALVWAVGLAAPSLPSGEAALQNR